jgi:phenylpropionate dioxygenase-like ring-hydroxylating dioxygenase large terminal subunit
VLDQDAILRESVDRELARTTYPEAFPPLPEVPVARYTSPQFFDLEMRHVWRKSWLMAGHISELPEVGSYKLLEKLDRSIIISRGKDGAVRAFHNTCRHRGSALLLEAHGRTRRFVCPYHAWTYDLEGQLLSVPDAHNFACLDQAERHLIPVRCELWKGLIYINLDPEAGSLADFLAPVTRQLGDFPLEKVVVKDRIRIEMDCNWKAAYDNFLEIYHVNVVHAKSIARFLNSKTFLVSLLANGHSRFTTRRKLGDTIFGTNLAAPEEALAHLREHTVALPTFPNGFVALDPVAFVWQTFWPNGIGKSVMEAFILGWSHDGEDDPEFWQGMRANTLGILAEDVRLFGSMQRSFESGVLPGLVMGCQERALYWYQEEIDRRIGVENIPPELRITPVLANQIID